MPAAVIIRSDVAVFHDDATATGGCRVSFNIDISGDVVTVNYDQDEIGLTAQNKTSIDNLLTAIKNAAVGKLKADMAGVTLGAGA